MGELADNVNKGRDTKDDIGDCLVCLIIIAQQQGYSIDECLAVAYKEIKDRKGIMINGVFVKEGEKK